MQIFFQNFRRIILTLAYYFIVSHTYLILHKITWPRYTRHCKLRFATRPVLVCIMVNALYIFNINKTVINTEDSSVLTRRATFFLRKSTAVQKAILCKGQTLISLTLSVTELISKVTQNFIAVIKSEVEHRLAMSTARIKISVIQRTQLCFTLVTSRHWSVSATLSSCITKKVILDFSRSKDRSTVSAKLIA